MLFKVCTNFTKIPLQRILVTVIKFENIRNVHENHYQVLGLPRNCCTKHIKEAFVKLSKTYHPDVNSDGLAHHQFLKVLEAYNVLSKPISRKIYDVELNHYSLYGDLQSINHRPRPGEYDYDSPAYWCPRQTHYQDQCYEKHNYHNKASRNKMASLMCLFFSALGAIILYYHIIVIIQFCAIRNSAKRDFLLAQSLENESRNELQLHLLEQKICK